MEKIEFEKLVQEGIDQIPETFLKRLENVAIVVEDEPDAEQLAKARMDSHSLLFGLYEGIPQTKRGPHYGMVFPDKITIFQKPIENYAGSDEQIREIVKNTVCHEIAHHFGSDERGARRSERKNKAT